ncbi:hypothetical protein ACHAWC_003563 [Mediolabrus comicus]
MDYSQFSLRGSRWHLQKEEGDEEWRKLWYGGDDEVEEVDFWRTTAGWADDDASMVQYNHAVYNRIYEEGDDDYDIRSIESSIWTSEQRAHAVKHYALHPFVLMGALAAVLFCLFMFCCCAISKKDKKGKRSDRKKKKVAAKMKRMKGSSRELTDKLGERRSRSSSRSRARSKSRSREGAPEKVSDDYQLIDGGESSKRRDSDGNKSRSDGESRSSSKSSTRERVDAAENEKVLNESACNSVEEEDKEKEVY